MDPVTAELRAYYEEEARQGLRGPRDGWRLDVRRDFVDLVRSEGRTSVIDFGAGPGHEVEAFGAEGLRAVGVDLAHGNGVAAARRGVHVVHGSIGAPPVRPRSFDAGWTMSVVMHVAEDELVATVGAMTGPLRPGAPLQIGLWGGERRLHVVDDRALVGRRRPFDLRPPELNRALLGSVAPIEWSAVETIGPDGWNYQLFRLRIPER